MMAQGTVKGESVEQMMARLREKFEQASLLSKPIAIDTRLQNAKKNSRRPSGRPGAQKHPNSSIHISPGANAAPGRFRKQHSILRDDDLLKEMEGDLFSSLDEIPEMDSTSPSPVYSTNGRPASNMGGRPAFQPPPVAMGSQQYQQQIHTIMIQFEMEKRAWFAQMNELTLQWEADKARMAPLDKQFKDFQDKARRDKVDAQIQIDDLKRDLKTAKEQLARLQAEKDNFQNVLNKKDEDVNQMKVMVDAQMNQMRTHFMGLQQEHQKVLKLKESLSSRVETAESQVADLKRQLTTRNGELLESQQKVDLYIAKTNKAEAQLVELQTNSMGKTEQSNVQINELQQKIGALTQQHQQLYMVYENLKNNYVKTKVEADKATRKAQELAEKYRRSDAEKKELVVMMETLLNNTEGFSEGTENFSE